MTSSTPPVRDHHWRLPHLLITSMTIVTGLGGLIMLALLTADCGVQSTWYRMIENQIPLPPVPARTYRLDAGTLLADLRPPTGSTSVSASYMRVLYVSDTSVSETLAFYQQRGATCRVLDQPEHQRFATAQPLVTWQCESVPFVPWETGSIQITTLAEFTVHLRSLSLDEGDLAMQSYHDQWRRALGDEMIGSVTTPMSTTAIFASAIWCETP